MTAIRLGMAAALLCGTAWAQTPPANPGTFYIAPGTPATVGRSGSVTGVVPGQAVPAPRGSMSTFGGHFGTEGPLDERNKTGAAQPASAPVPGTSSFTMREARRRIEAGGFTQVTGLQKDHDGVWRGKAMRNGAAANVFCDFQGNVGAL